MLCSPTPGVNNMSGVLNIVFHPKYILHIHYTGYSIFLHWLHYSIICYYMMLCNSMTCSLTHTYIVTYVHDIILHYMYKHMYITIMQVHTTSANNICLAVVCRTVLWTNHYLLPYRIIHITKWRLTRHHGQHHGRSYVLWPFLFETHVLLYVMVFYAASMHNALVCLSKRDMCFIRFLKYLIWTHT